ncbi:hypothetical protein [Paraurantiacibacter namhicola]|uniref:Uncharacterized protein n=1 Tax=Paraurantiacibacter namhicola TaxID=645517 RepID=A0A1C7D7I5_9SPHN|nr:hypothetical protein [Paraurantiacibacter namhicola]ANU07397.1 hypothetical protein A6F65_01089 [Paraurantiacibacter namhicola]
MRTLVLPMMLLALAACGNQKGLERPEDYPPPKVPYGREEALDADELLTPDQMAVPARSVEPEARSGEREDDPFDLPPEG